MPPADPDADPTPGTPDRWFLDHYEYAAEQIVQFLGDVDMSLEGKDVADVGCGDGIIDLGLMHRARPARLVGFDIRRTSEEHLLEVARTHGVAAELPDGLEFVESEPVRIPAEDASFDVVVTWSTFEHVREPVGLASEMRRILRPYGAVFLQLWPFYHSDRGSHLWEWFPEPFHHLLHDDDELERGMHPVPGREEWWPRMMLEEYRGLNRMTADDLQRALLAGGLAVRRVELQTGVFNIPPELARYPLSTLAISGIKLLAGPV
jgi:SAM-dependent methyltransferase